jgi:hypothetical protein
MCQFNVTGLVALVPATVLLTVSFFVLLALQKAEAKGLKIFGAVIVALLCLSALLVFASGLTGRNPMMRMMPDRMRGRMGGPPPMMQQQMMNK